MNDGIPLGMQPRFVVLQQSAQDVIEYARGLYPDQHFIVIALEGPHDGASATATSVAPPIARRVLRTAESAFKKASRGTAR